MWKILCASNSPEVNAQLDLLDRANYEVRLASSFGEACTLFITNTFDVYLLDADMKGEKAVQMVKAVRLADEHGVVIWLSQAESDRGPALDAGADIFLLTSTEVEFLRFAIEDLRDKTRLRFGVSGPIIRVSTGQRDLQLTVLLGHVGVGTEEVAKHQVLPQLLSTGSTHVQVMPR